MSATLDQVLAKAMELRGAGVLFVAPCRFVGPGPGVLLMHAKDGLWELPSSDVAPDVRLDDSTIFGDVVINRCDEFQPVLGERYDDHCWTSPDYAVGCTSNHPKATAAIQQFIADSGNSTGALVMDSAKDFIDAQAAAEPTYKAFNDSAPPRMQGEGLADYEGRLVRPHQRFSKQFKDADLAKIGCPITRRALAAQIYKDALQEAVHPTALSLGPRELRAIKERDQSGREKTRYVASDDGACWDQFNPAIRHVRRFLVPGSV